ncbi:hypothetical protein AtDm6_0437 [Acetobacter tropicalis]|uniref:Uncharacterized protein n=1 Tax=Acetobacter tropicalis TaxID=104102 RepID=A0A095BBJ5_9PROT|nr:hypothetical protein AtDm6_0437 [Acetobacter tropicalis]
MWGAHNYGQTWRGQKISVAAFLSASMRYGLGMIRKGFFEKSFTSYSGKMVML